MPCMFYMPDDVTIVSKQSVDTRLGHVPCSSLPFPKPGASLRICYCLSIRRGNHRKFIDTDVTSG